jgi:hypothetical protein
MTLITCHECGCHRDGRVAQLPRPRLPAAEAELGKIKEPAPETASIERLIPRIGERYLAMVRELNKAAERDPVRARQALLQALEGPITLHPENGVLVADRLHPHPCRW